MIRNIIVFLLTLLLLPLRLLVPRGKTIILHTYSPFVFCDNTRYLFEYLSEKTDYDVYWVTDSPEIMAYLDQKHFKYITKKRLLQRIWVCLKAGVIIDTGGRFFNFLNLCRSGTLKISTMHGNGPKTVTNLEETFEENMRLIRYYNEFDHINFGAPYACREIGAKLFKIPMKRLINFGFPRCDQFFDNDYVLQNYKLKPVAKKFFPEINETAKIILYTPTWRHYPYDFPLFNMTGFDTQVFDGFLKQINAYFFFTLHALQQPDKLIAGMHRQKYISQTQHPVFDINKLMMETDVLVNDCSNTSTDFALLNRPQIFFMPDYEQYVETKGFVEDYLPVMPGKEVVSFQDFKDTIVKCLNEPENYKADFTSQRDRLLEHYYTPTLSNSCARYNTLIDDYFNKKN